MKIWLERHFNKKNNATYDSEYQFGIDRRRIINSSAFRRLQAKTQVHSIGESDFFRTRLTHSLEVSQIGISIRNRLHFISAKNSDYDIDILPPIPLIETICLAHDIGHPAFGHNGERIINSFMFNNGGFEGNGQTLRILTKLGEFSEKDGYNLTRRSLLGVLKYPILFSECKVKYKETSDDFRCHDISKWTPPKCILDDEKEVFEWILSPFSETDKKLFTSTKEKNGVMKSIYKSLDTSIMECADDIAFGLHDIEDALVTNLIHPIELYEDLEYEFNFFNKIITKNYSGGNNEDYLRKNIISPKINDIKKVFSQILNILINSTNIYKVNEFDSDLLDYQCVIDNEKNEILKAFKSYLYEKVIANPNAQTIEFKGQEIISKLFQTLIANPRKLLPYSQQSRLENTSVKRVVSDYISSLTDLEASKLYQRLFMPEQGTVFGSIY